MTFALYISPKSVIAPIIVTDTITSDINGNVFGIIATRTRDLLKYVDTDLTSLVRKTFFPNENVAIAFSGELSCIHDFLTYADILTRDLSSERPLALLAQHASQYSSGKVNVISNLCLPVDGVCHRVKPDGCVEYELDGLGYFAAIGSGGKHIVNQVKDLARSFEFHDISDLNSAHSLVNILCLDELVREVYNFDEKGRSVDNTWGGILEYIYYDPRDHKWHRQPSSAYFIYQIDMSLSETDLRPQLIDRYFLYEPGQESGWLHAVRSSEFSSYNISYRLTSIITRGEDAQSIDWQTWSPKRVNLCIVCGRREGEQFIGHSKFFGGYEVDDDNGVTCHIGRTGVRFLPFGLELESFLVEGVKAMRGKLG